MKELARLKTRVLNVLKLPLRAKAVDQALSALTQGKSPRDWIARLPANHHQYAVPSRRRVTRHGIAYDLDVSDFMEWLIYFGVQTEPREKLFSLAHPADTLIDVGTNVGEVLLNFARITGPRGKVYGFEPDPVNHGKCQVNLRRNSFENIELVQLGLGDVEATLHLGVTTGRNRGGVRTYADGGTGTVAVKAITLDSFVAERALTKVHLVKIDVEGFELNVLRGAAKTLERFKPKLFIELDDGNLRAQKGTARELVSFLDNAGYRMTNADDDSPVHESDDFTSRHFDIIGIPKP